MAYLAPQAVPAWYTTLLLLYICFNLSAYLLQESGLKPLFPALSALFIGIVAYGGYPLFALLLPMNLYELASSFLRNKWPIFLAMLVPLPFLPPDHMALYGFIATFCFLYNAMLADYAGKLAASRDAGEAMRADVHRLTKSLSENNEYIRQSEYTFKLEERSRLSQEIHDKIGHSMTGALIQMEAAKRLMASDPDKSSELLQNAIRISKDGIESIRLVLKDMKPLTEQLGVGRMRLFIDEFAASHPVQASLTYDGDLDRITPLHWKIIQQNVTEALTNAMKYARASAVSVHIQVLNGYIKATVTDNGVGSPKVIKGLGLIGMEERTAAVNGTVVVDGSRGFTVTTLMPYAT
ncbi:sensor histidine kinase [Paenibacillus arenilitoris]|uniref:histidine kinase n=1 Tax=Paenibacillus arenilitoris TaxID=2772299 RepID=A0A927CTG4_9BACL|nr:sensor histidine kinase [Paenibacillus arenilitoris]